MTDSTTKAVLSPEELKEIRERAEKATPGPWEYRPNRFDDWGWVRGPDGWPVANAKAGADCDEDVLATHRIAGTDPYQHNGDFITSARVDIPRLLATVEALQAELAQTKAILSDPTAVWCNMLRGGIAIPAKVKDALMRAEKDTTP
jgi:hypothetical protein